MASGLEEAHEEASASPSLGDARLSSPQGDGGPALTALSLGSGVLPWI